jgi:cytochrome P450 family 4
VLKVDTQYPHGDLLIPILYVPRFAEYFHVPMKFDPDNVLPKRVVKRHPYFYIPFSAGPRNCIDQKSGLLEKKTILSYILRHNRLHAVHKEMSIIPDMILRPKNGVSVTVAPRNKNLSV